MFNLANYYAPDVFHLKYCVIIIIFNHGSHSCFVGICNHRSIVCNFIMPRAEAYCSSFVCVCVCVSFRPLSQFAAHAER